jgi:general secretion pathway protein L
MAHTVLGIDLGAHTVKMVELEVGLRTLRLIASKVRSVGRADPAGNGVDPLTLAGQAIAETLGRRRGSYVAEEAHAALWGDALTLRLLDLPFSEDKKIDSVIGYELEGQVPFAIEDLFHDYVVMKRDRTGSRLLATAARRDRVQALLSALAEAGVDPRTVGAAPLAYATLGAFLPPTEGPAAIVDIGHVRTNVCVVQAGEKGSEPLFARTLLGGGHLVTERLRTVLGITYDEAETLKHTETSLPGGDATPAPLHQHLTQQATAALAPLVRDLRQTLFACEARQGTPVERVVLCGGGARLRGAAPWFEQQLGVPVEPLQIPPESGLLPPDLQPAGQAMLAQALALALRGAERSELPDLRQGDLAYRGDVSVLRGRLFHVAAAALILLGLATANGYAALSSLRKERHVLEPRLRAATAELFGQAEMDGAAIQRRLQLGDKAEGPPIADMTALDVMDEISRHTPPTNEVRLDVQELEIKAKKTYVKGTTDSAASVDALVESLKKSPCVTDIQKGRISDIGGQGAQKQFTLTLSTKCF